MRSSLLLFILRRFLMLIPVMLGISIIIFVLARVIPGDPARLALGEAATAQSIDALRHEMGLDKPIYEQYWIYFKGLLKGDLGRSVRTNQPVLKDLMTHFLATLELTLVAMVFTVVLAIPLGILSAVKRNSLVDHTSRVIALAGVSMPIFWLGLILIYLFFYLLNWAPPPTGRLSILSRPPATITGLYLIDSLLAGNFSLFLECFKFLLMPAFCLATWSFAMLLRMTRSGMLEVLSEDYIRTARAKGLPTRMVVSKHALKNAIIPLLTVLGIIFGVLLNGAILTETIFSWPGIGRYVVESISWLDYSPIQGMTIFASVIYTLVNLMVDILYTMVDPRIRLFVRN